MFYTRLIDEGYIAKSRELRSKLLAFKLGRVVNKMSSYMAKKNRIIKETMEKAEEMLKKQDVLWKGYEENFRKIYESREENRWRKKDVPTKLAKKLDNWEIAHSEGSKRFGESCPICLGAMGKGKPLVVTSCGHLFHRVCLEGFESYSPMQVPLCPYCRATYDSAPFNP